ncbi:MAG TPA: hypothetical protein VFR82_11555 [Nitrospira sp.]|nr:hypothetical protein [Nitrospira sp.]
MKNTLYLLRKPVDRVDPALFIASHSKGDVVLLDTALVSFPHSSGTVFSLGTQDGERTISYDVLVQKIFESDAAIVI